MSFEEVMIFSPTPPGLEVSANHKDINNRIKIFKELGVKVTYMHIKSRNSLSSISNDINNLSEVIDYIGDRRVLCWLEYSKTSFIASILRKSCSSIKIVYRVHNFELLHFLDKLRLENKLNTLEGAWGTFKHLINIIVDEFKMLISCDEIFCISREDSKLYSKIINDKSNYLPYVNKTEIPKHMPMKREKLNVFYMGSDLSYTFNREGLDFIVKNIAPKIKDKKVKFYILGKNIPDGYSLESDNVEFAGYVENLDDFLLNMDVSILPIRHGYGIKVKALESLFRGFPSIGFKQTFRGISVMPENNVLIAKDSEDFVEYLKRMNDLEERVKLSGNALLNKEIQDAHKNALSILSNFFERNK